MAILPCSCSFLLMGDDVFNETSQARHCDHKDQREAIPPAIVAGCDIIGASETVSPVTSGICWV